MVVTLIDHCDVDIDIPKIIDSLQAAETSADDDKAVSGVGWRLDFSHDEAPMRRPRPV